MKKEKEQNKEKIDEEMYLANIIKINDLPKNHKDRINKHGFEVDNENNGIILSENLSVDSNIGSNVFVIGGSGSGKDHNYIEPNVKKANSTYIINDMFGFHYDNYASYLKEKGYKIKKFDINDSKKSNSYNPFSYLKNDYDIFMMTEIIIKNTEGIKAFEKEEIINTERFLIAALIVCTLEQKNKSDVNFRTFFRLAGYEGKKETMSLEKLNNEFSKLKEGSNALVYYKKFKKHPAHYKHLAVSSLEKRLSKIWNPKFLQATDKDDIELETLGDKKTALFVINSPIDTTYKFMINLLYSQTYSTLIAYSKKEGKISPLPVNVHLIMDEAVNSGIMPDLRNNLLIAKFYNISTSFMLQSISQIKELYYDYKEIISFFDAILYTGGTADELTEEILNLYLTNAKYTNIEMLNAKKSKKSKKSEKGEKQEKNENGDCDKDKEDDDGDYDDIKNENLCFVFLGSNFAYIDNKYDLI